MNITSQVKKKIEEFPEGYVFTSSDFDLDLQYQTAIGKALNRLVKSGEIEKLAKGRFYKPQKTQFGIVMPSVYQTVKDYIEYEGKLWSLTALAKHFTGSGSNIAGTRYFKYQGEWLHKLRERLGG